MTLRFYTLWQWLSSQSLTENWGSIQEGVHAKGVVLCERMCFCLPSVFYDSLPLLRTLLRTFVLPKALTRRPLRTLLRSTSFEDPSKNPSKKRGVAWPPWCTPKSSSLWNGWGYGVSFFGGSDFSKLGFKTVCGTSGIFPQSSGSKNIPGLRDIGVSIHHQSIPPVSAGQRSYFPYVRGCICCLGPPCCDPPSCKPSDRSCSLTWIWFLHSIVVTASASYREGGKKRPEAPISKPPSSDLRWAKSPIAAVTERNQLLQAIPQFNVERMLHDWTPIARFESQHDERRVYENQFLCVWGRCDRQWTPVIRIAAITATSDHGVLDGMPPTGLQLLREERVLSTLWIKGLEHMEKWSKVVGRPLGGAPWRTKRFCDNYRVILPI